MPWRHHTPFLFRRYTRLVVAGHLQYNTDWFLLPLITFCRWDVYTMLMKSSDRVSFRFIYICLLRVTGHLWSKLKPSTQSYCVLIECDVLLSTINCHSRWKYRPLHALQWLPRNRCIDVVPNISTALFDIVTQLCYVTCIVTSTDNCHVTRNIGWDSAR